MGALYSYMYPSASTKPCGWCQKLGHRLAFCPDFAPIKNATSLEDYSAKDGILPKDQQGFCSAGITCLAFDSNSKCKILMIEEERNGEKKFNFIGGKRENKREQPWETAIREFNEEMDLTENKCPDTDSGPFIRECWYAQGKYVLYVGLVISNVDVTKSSIAKCQWVDIEEIDRVDKVHGFALEMVSSFGLKQLESEAKKLLLFYR